MADYYPDPVDSILHELQQTFTDKFRVYYDGDPDENVAESNLPMIAVYKTEADYGITATSTDRITSNLTIRLIINKKDYIGSSTDADMAARELKRLCEGRDASNGQYIPQSLMGVFRTKLTLGDSVINNNARIGYAEVLRSDELTTAEAFIFVTTEERVIVPNRM